MQGIRDALGRLAPLTTAALLVSGASATAQSIQILLVQGDSIPGATGTLAGITDVAIADDGQWLVRAAVSGGGSSFEIAILNGAAVLNAGDGLFDPPGLTVTRFDEVDLTPDGTLWWNITTSATGTTDEIMYRNLTKFGREGDPVFDPTQPAGTIWKDFDGFQLNSIGQVLTLGDIDSPAITSGNDAALALHTFDASGVLIDETFLVLEGDGLPGSADKVLDVGTNAGAHDVAVSDTDWIAYVRNDAGASTDETILFNGQIVAREGTSGPDIGTIWGSLSSNAVDVNNKGDFVFRGELLEIGGPTIEAIFLNGVPFISSGDTSDSLAPHSLESFGSNTPIMLGENGNIVYFGQTDNSNTATDTGYFLNDRYLVQENTTAVGLQVIGRLVGAAGGLDISPSGRYVIFEAEYGDGSDIVGLIDLGLIEVMESCATAPASLTHVDGIPLLGETVQFQMDGEQDFGVTPVLMLSTAPVVGWPPCGLMTSFGELLVEISVGNGNPAIVQFGPTSEFLPVDFFVTAPNDTALLNRDFFAQGFWWDVGDQSPAENFRLTNGLKITLAPQ